MYNESMDISEVVVSRLQCLFDVPECKSKRRMGKKILRSDADLAKLALSS